MFSMVYSVRHNDYGEITFRSDYRIRSRKDLKLHPDLMPLKMHCRKCYLEIKATHFEVWEPERLRVKKATEETTIDQLNNVCGMLTNSYVISDLQL